MNPTPKALALTGVGFLVLAALIFWIFSPDILAHLHPTISQSQLLRIEKKDESISISPFELLLTEPIRGFSFSLPTPAQGTIASKESLDSRSKPSTQTADETLNQVIP